MKQINNEQKRFDEIENITGFENELTANKIDICNEFKKSFVQKIVNLAQQNTSFHLPKII